MQSARTRSKCIICKCLSYADTSPQQILVLFSRKWTRSFHRHNSIWWKQGHKSSPEYGKIPWKNSGLLYCWPASHPMSFLPFTVGSCIVFPADTMHTSTFSVTGDCKAAISLGWIVRIPGNDRHLEMFLHYSMDICQCEFWLLIVHAEWVLSSLHNLYCTPLLDFSLGSKSLFCSADQTHLQVLIHTL